MEDLNAQGIKTLKMDITNNDEIQTVVDAIKNEQGQLDILYNHAGFGLYGPVELLTIDQAKYQFKVNIFGLAILTQEVLLLMRDQNSGKIFNVSSMGGKMYTPLRAWYHATKQIK